MSDTSPEGNDHDQLDDGQPTAAQSATDALGDTTTHSDTTPPADNDATPVEWEAQAGQQAQTARIDADPSGQPTDVIGRPDDAAASSRHTLPYSDDQVHGWTSQAPASGSASSWAGPADPGDQGYPVGEPVNSAPVASPYGTHASRYEAPVEQTSADASSAGSPYPGQPDGRYAPQQPVEDAYPSANAQPGGYQSGAPSQQGYGPVDPYPTGAVSQYAAQQQNPYGTQQHPGQYGAVAPSQQAQAAADPYRSSVGGQYGSQQPQGGWYGSASTPGSSAAPTSAYGDGGAGGSGAGSATKSNDRKRLVLPLVGMLVIGAVIGGVVGAGAAHLWGPSGTTVTSSSGGGNLTVNDYNSATVVTAVAAKATSSVVTINVSAGDEAGTGSGVVLSKDGYIVTNTHVVTLDGDSSKGSIQVTTSDGKIYTGKLVATDPTVDLAVIKINVTGLKPMTFANSSKLNVGDTAVAIGAPLGLSNTVTDGIVSTLNRSIQVTSSAPGDSSGDSNDGGNGGSGPYDFWGNGDNGSASTKSTVSLPVIQTDAAINPGNSGGALLDSKGRLIGINVAIASASSSSSSSDSQSGSIGVGFSIPANLVKRVANEIISAGKATHGLLGASVSDNADVASATQDGALIKSVTSGGAAASAGLRKGDIVTGFGGVRITDGSDLTAQVHYFAGGAKSTITYLRGDKSYTADVALGTYDSDS